MSEPQAVQRVAVKNPDARMNCLIKVLAAVFNDVTRRLPGKARMNRGMKNGPHRWEPSECWW